MNFNNYWYLSGMVLSYTVLVVANDTALNAVVDLTNDFGACVLQALVSPRMNTVFSPYGLVSVLVLLHEGANSTSPTAIQLAKALRMPSRYKDLTQLGFRDLHRYLKSYFTSDGFLRGLILSNPKAVLSQHYLRTLKYYGFEPDASIETTTTVHSKKRPSGVQSETFDRNSPQQYPTAPPNDTTEELGTRSHIPMTLTPIMAQPTKDPFEIKKDGTTTGAIKETKPPVDVGTPEVPTTICPPITTVPLPTNINYATEIAPEVDGNSKTPETTTTESPLKSKPEPEPTTMRPDVDTRTTTPSVIKKSTQPVETTTHIPSTRDYEIEGRTATGDAEIIPDASTNTEPDQVTTNIPDITNKHQPDVTITKSSLENSANAPTTITPVNQNTLDVRSKVFDSATEAPLAYPPTESEEMMESASSISSRTYLSTQPPLVLEDTTITVPDYDNTLEGRSSLSSHAYISTKHPSIPDITTVEITEESQTVEDRSGISSLAYITTSRPSILEDSSTLRLPEDTIESRSSDSSQVYISTKQPAVPEDTTVIPEEVQTLEPRSGVFSQDLSTPFYEVTTVPTSDEQNLGSRSAISSETFVSTPLLRIPEDSTETISEVQTLEPRSGVFSQDLSTPFYEVTTEPTSDEQNLGSRSGISSETFLSTPLLRILEDSTEKISEVQTLEPRSGISTSEQQNLGSRPGIPAETFLSTPLPSIPEDSTKRVPEVQTLVSRSSTLSQEYLPIEDMTSGYTTARLPSEAYLSTLQPFILEDRTENLPEKDQILEGRSLDVLKFAGATSTISPNELRELSGRRSDSTKVPKTLPGRSGKGTTISKSDEDYYGGTTPTVDQYDYVGMDLMGRSFGNLIPYRRYEQRPKLDKNLEHDKPMGSTTKAGDLEATTQPMELDVRGFTTENTNKVPTESTDLNDGSSNDFGMEQRSYQPTTTFAPNNQQHEVVAEVNEKTIEELPKNLGENSTDAVELYTQTSNPNEFSPTEILGQVESRTSPPINSADTHKLQLSDYLTPYEGSTTTIGYDDDAIRRSGTTTPNVNQETSVNYMDGESGYTTKFFDALSPRGLPIKLSNDSEETVTFKSGSNDVPENATDLGAIQNDTSENDYQTTTYSNKLFSEWVTEIPFPDERLGSRKMEFNLKTTTEPSQAFSETASTIDVRQGKLLEPSLPIPSKESKKPESEPIMKHRLDTIEDSAQRERQNKKKIKNGEDSNEDSIEAHYRSGLSFIRDLIATDSKKSVTNLSDYTKFEIGDLMDIEEAYNDSLDYEEDDENAEDYEKDFKEVLDDDEFEDYFNVDDSSEANSIKLNESTIKKNNRTRKPRSIHGYPDDKYWPRDNLLGRATYRDPTQQWFTTFSGEQLVPVLTVKAFLPYAEVPGLDAQVLQIPLDVDYYTMLLILPKRKLGLKELLYSLQWCKLRSIVAALRTTPVYAVIPTFTMVHHINLVNLLTRLGVTDIFDPNKADLSVMSNDPYLHVKSIEQVVTMSVREHYNGNNQHRWYDATESQIQQHFMATQPFAFFVIDTETKVSLVAGTVVDPLSWSSGI